MRVSLLVHVLHERDSNHLFMHRILDQGFRSACKAGVGGISRTADSAQATIGPVCDANARWACRTSCGGPPQTSGTACQSASRNLGSSAPAGPSASALILSQLGSHLFAHGSPAWHLYCSRPSSGLTSNALFMPRLPSSTQLSISAGVRAY